VIYKTINKIVTGIYKVIFSTTDSKVFPGINNDLALEFLTLRYMEKYFKETIFEYPLNSSDEIKDLH